MQINQILYVISIITCIPGETAAKICFSVLLFAPEIDNHLTYAVKCFDTTSSFYSYKIKWLKDLPLPCT